MFKISLKSNLNPTFFLNLITSFKDYKFKKSFKPFKYTLKILLILILITNFLLILDPLFLAIETKAAIQKNQQEIESLEKLENPQENPQNFEENLQENPQNPEENPQKPKNSDLNETKANDPVLEKPVSPVLERIQEISDTQFLAIFGYNNQNEASISIPVGDNNYFHPTPANRNQTQEFKPGRQRATFTVEMECKQTLVWTLKSPDGSKRTSTAATPNCPEKPDEDQDEEEIDLDTTLPNSNLHFFDKVTSLENNQIKLTQTACYYLNPVHISNSLQNSNTALSVLQKNQNGQETEKILTDNFTKIYPYLKLEKYNKNQELSFKFQIDNPKNEVLSSDVQKVKIWQIENGLFRLFVNFKTNQNSNLTSNPDLILDFLIGNCQENLQQGESPFIDIFQDLKTEEANFGLNYTKANSLDLAYLTDNWTYYSDLESLDSISDPSKDSKNPNQIKNQNQIIAIRFLDQNGNPEVLDKINSNDSDHSNYLDKCNPPLCNLHPNNHYQKNNQAPGLQWSERWYSWNGGYFLRNLELPIEGIYQKSFEVIDYYGNLTKQTQWIIKDNKAPEIKNSEFSDFQLNFIDKNRTDLKSKLEFELLDSGLTSLLNHPEINQKLNPEQIAKYSKLEFQYSFDNQSWSDWKIGNLGKNFLEINFENLTKEQLETLKKDQKLELKIFFKIKDGLGNESENQSFTTLYEVQKPTLDLEFKTDKTRKLTEKEIQKIQEENQAKNTKLDLNSLEPEIKVSYTSIVDYLTNFQTSPNIPITRVRFFEKQESLDQSKDQKAESKDGDGEPSEENQDLNSTKLNQWQELDPFSQNYNQKLEQILKNGHDFSLHNGYEPIGFFNLCLEIEDILGQVSNISCDLVSLEFNPEPIYDPKTPFANQPISCNNPYNWIEDVSKRDKNSKTYFIPKQIREELIGGEKFYILESFGENQQKIEIKVPKTQYIKNPDPNKNPEYFFYRACLSTENIHFKDKSTNDWVDIDDYLYKLTPETPQRQAGYMYANVGRHQTGGNSFTVYFGDDTDTGFWYFSDELDFKIDKIKLLQDPNNPSNSLELNFSKARVRNGTITYPEVLDGVDLKFTVHSTGVKKEIIIKNKEALQKNNFSNIVFDFRSNKDLNQKFISTGNPFEFGVASEILFENSQAKIQAPTIYSKLGTESAYQKIFLNKQSNQLLFQPNQEILNKFKNGESDNFPLVIDPNISTNSSQATFASKNDPTINQAHRWFAATGRYFIDTSNNNAPFGQSRAFLSFNLPKDVNSNSTINTATLNLQQYNTYKEAFTAQIKEVNSFNQNQITWNNQPALGHHFANIDFPFVNLNGGGNTHNTTGDITNFIRERRANNTINFAIVDSNETGNYRGTAFCNGRNPVSGHPCDSSNKAPRIQIDYYNNLKPTPPRPQTPDGNEYIGNCDLSKTPSSGNCTPVVKIPYYTTNINDGNGGAGYYTLDVKDIITDRDYWYSLPGRWSDSKFTSYTWTLDTRNGIYQWSARNKDDYGLVSDMGASKTTVVDTQSPLQLEEFELPQNLDEGQVEFEIPKFIDNLHHKVRFRMFGTDNYLFASSHSLSANINLEIAGLATIRQEWVMEANGLIIGSRGKCLEIDRNNNNNLRLASCNSNSTNQVFEYTKNQELKLKSSDLCLDGRGKDAGDNVYGHWCHGGDNQKFILESFTKERINTNNNLAIDFSGATHPNTTGEKIHLWTNHSNENQAWEFVPVKNNDNDGNSQDVFLIRGRGNKCIDSPNRQNNGMVHGWACDYSNPNQRWIFENNQIKLKDSPNLCLAVASKDPKQRDLLGTYNCSETQSQAAATNLKTEYFRQRSNPTWQMSYFVQVATDPNFTNDSIFYQGWQSSQTFQLACVYDENGWIIPEDKLDETTQIPRTCLQDGQTYYIRLKAKDRQHSLDPAALNRGNISKWSQIQNFKVDLSIPLVKNIFSQKDRISANNKDQTNLDLNQNLTNQTKIEYDFSTKNFQKATLQIRNQQNQVVATLENCLIDNQFKACNQNNLDYIFDENMENDDPANFKTVEFQFDGKNNQGQKLPDGAYNILPVTYNQNNKTNDLKISTNQKFLIVDSSFAAISLSSGTNIFSKENEMEISGQVGGFNQPNLQDRDFEKLEIRKINTNPVCQVLNPEQNPEENPQENILFGCDNSTWQEIPLGLTLPDLENPNQEIIKDSLFKFKLNSAPELELRKGLNRYQLRSTDRVGNQTLQIGNPSETASLKPYLEIFLDEVEPTFTEILPLGKVDIPENSTTNPATVTFSFIDDSLTQELLNSNFNFKLENPNQNPTTKQRIQAFENYSFSLLFNSKGDLTPDQEKTSNWIEFPVLRNGQNISSKAAELTQNLGCFIEPKTIYQEINGEFLEIEKMVITCQLKFGNLPLAGLYKPLIQIQDLAGNQVCNLDSTDYIAFESKLDCQNSQIQDQDSGIMNIVESKNQKAESKDEEERNQEQKAENEIENPEPEFEYQVFNPSITFQITQNQNQDTLLITSPETGYITDRGVVNVVGVGPVSDAVAIAEPFPKTKWKVEVCIDSQTVPNQTECDYTFETYTDSSGLFYGIAILPNLADQFIISAIATKYEYGNQTQTKTDTSNLVNIKYDTKDPFINIKAIPSFYGINTKAEIDKFITGELTIEQIRSIQLRSILTENTQAVDLDFADYSGLNTLPNTDLATGYSQIYNPDGRVAILNRAVESRQNFNPNQSPFIKKEHSKFSINDKNINPPDICTKNHPDYINLTNLKNQENLQTNEENGCVWTYNYPTPYWIGGGIYEIRFRGYKGEIVQDLTQGTAIDGVLTSAPRLLKIVKNQIVQNCQKSPESPENTNTQDQECQNETIQTDLNQVQNSFYTNQTSNQLIGAADPNSEIELTLTTPNNQIQTYTTTTNSSGIWTIDLDLKNSNLNPNQDSNPNPNPNPNPNQDINNHDGKYQINISATLNQNTTKALEEYSLTLDTILPIPISIQTTNISNNQAINPWLMTGDLINFQIQTNKPLNYLSVYGELGFRKDLYRIQEAESKEQKAEGESKEQKVESKNEEEEENENESDNSDKCHLTNTCTKEQLEATEFTGNLLILRPLQGIYFPYLKLQDLAGNTVFYANNPNIQNINIDPYDENENIHPKIYLNPENPLENLPENTHTQIQQDPRPENYPYSTNPRQKSHDFRLFIDNKKPQKRELNIDGWGDRLNGVYASQVQVGLAPNDPWGTTNSESKEQKVESKNENQLNFQPQTPPLPEADRLLTDQNFFLNPDCEIDINNPDKTSLWQIYAPNGIIDPTTNTNKCPYSPAFVTKHQTITIQGLAEKNQRITLTKARIKKDQNNQNQNILDQTDYLEFAAADHITQCYNYQDNLEFFPSLDYKLDQNGNKTTTGEPIPGMHTDLISRGNLITKFHEICQWEYQVTLDDLGQSPQGIPQNWYRISYHIKDLAGNTPVETDNDEIGD